LSKAREASKSRIDLPEKRQQAENLTRFRKY
jgi:hypothetical protein